VSTNGAGRFSKPPHSAALPPLRGLLSTAYHIYFNSPAEQLLNICGNRPKSSPKSSSPPRLPGRRLCLSPKPSTLCFMNRETDVATGEKPACRGRIIVVSAWSKASTEGRGNYDATIDSRLVSHSTSTPPVDNIPGDSVCAVAGALSTGLRMTRG
jgi:hypothetical protein